MLPIVHSRVYLQFVDPAINANKQYCVGVLQLNSANIFNLYTSWGRIGSKLSEKSQAFGNLHDAIAAGRDIVSEKLNKGYIETRGPGNPKPRWWSYPDAGRSGDPPAERQKEEPYMPKRDAEWAF